jgi:3-oxoacyl-[acyl-carrier protein] reductase
LVHGGHDRAAADEVAGLVRQAGREAQVIVSDLRDMAAQDALVDAAWRWRGGVDYWVNNAGADVLTGGGAQVGFDEKLQLLWEVDVRGTIRLSRGIGQRMQAAGQGCIVNIGWDQAEFGMAGDAGEMFGPIKGAIICFTRSLARTLSPQVRVNCVAPGWIQTGWGETASEYWQARARGESLMERWGTPEDVAHVVQHLTSPASSFITGQVLYVNGGLQPWPKEWPRD